MEHAQVLTENVELIQIIDLETDNLLASEDTTNEIGTFEQSEIDLSAPRGVKIKLALRRLKKRGIAWSVILTVVIIVVVAAMTWRSITPTNKPIKSTNQTPTDFTPTFKNHTPPVSPTVIPMEVTSSTMVFSTAIPTPTSTTVPKSTITTTTSTEMITSTHAHASMAEIIQSMNTSVKPCDNFYDFACQGWVRNNPRPRHLSSWNVLRKLESLASSIVADILQDPKTPMKNALEHAKRLFQTCMETRNTTRPKLKENETLQLIWDTMDEFGGWPMLNKDLAWNASNFNLTKILAAFQKRFARPQIFKILSYQSPGGNVTNNKIEVRLASSSPDSNLKHEKSTKNPMNSFESLVRTISNVLLKFKGKPELDEKCMEEKIKELIVTFAEIKTTSPEELFPNCTQILDNSGPSIHTTLDKFQVALDCVADSGKSLLQLQTWLNILYENTGIEIQKNEPIFVGDINYALQMSKYLSNKNSSHLADYFSFRMAYEMMSDWTDKDQEREPGEQFCAKLVENRLGDSVMAQYVERLGFAHLWQVQEIFDSLKTSFANLITSKEMTGFDFNNWTVEAVESIKLCNGYPAWVNQSAKVQQQAVYDDLNLTHSTFLELIISINEWSAMKKLKTLRVPFDTNNGNDCKWLYFPGRTRVQIDTQRKLVYMPVGVLQVPIFDARLPRAILHGKLGSIFGHEITHGLVGRAAVTWRPKFMELMDDKSSSQLVCFANQYSSFEINDGLFVNGTRTLSENVADNFGLKAAYKAYKKDWKEEEIEKPKELEGYTDDQLFFLGFSQNWCEINTPDEMRRFGKEYKHSPGKFRVFGTLQNSKEFAEAWNCQSGSMMNPDAREQRKCIL